MDISQLLGSIENIINFSYLRRCSDVHINMWISVQFACRCRTRPLLHPVTRKIMLDISRIEVHVTLHLCMHSFKHMR